MTTQTLEAKNIVTKPAFTVVGMRVRTTPGNPNMMQLWMDFDGQQRVRGRTKPGVFYGAMHHFDTPTNEFDYVAGVQVQAGQTAPEGMVSWQIPAQTYAVFETHAAAGRRRLRVHLRVVDGRGGRRAGGRAGASSCTARFNPQDPASKMRIDVPRRRSRLATFPEERPAWERQLREGWRSQAGGV